MERDRLIELYRKMLLIRYFDEAAVDLYSRGEVAGGTHPYIGEEATAVGAIAALEKDDMITSTHRGHGHCLAKGGNPDLMMAELLGKKTGYCKGKGGSLHIADLDIGNLGASGIVGGGIPIATGAAFANHLRKTGKVVLCFFGDGAANTGAFHEAVNLASVWKLPVVFLCENNRYGMSVAVHLAFNIKNISQRAVAYGIPGETVDGNDVLAVCESTKKAVDMARAGKGPSLIECQTYRWKGHAASDPQFYRTREEVEEWKKKCPILRFRGYLSNGKVLSEKEADSIEEETQKVINKAVEFARSSPYPDPKEATEDVFSPPYIPPPLPKVIARNEVTWQSNLKMRKISYKDALREALREEMKIDENVVLFGEDIIGYGGAFGVTRDFHKEFGNDRVKDTPISEAAIAGAAVGAALCCLRPVAEIMYIDFIPIAMDQIVNQAAKIKYMFGGKPSLPLVIRTQGGGGKYIAAQHSQSLEAWFMHVPGLKIVMPSTPFDAKGLLKTAIRDDNPVIFIEHKMLYKMEGEVPEEEYLIPFGVADIKRTGKDITIVATSIMVHKALSVAETLSKDGIEAEIIDPRTLFPLDIDTIVNSVKKTGKLVIVHEAVKTGGIGAEIGMQVYERAFDHLDSPIVRVGALDVPIPCSPTLEKEVLPNEEKIIKAVKQVLG